MTWYWAILGVVLYLVLIMAIGFWLRARRRAGEREAMRPFDWKGTTVVPSPRVPKGEAFMVGSWPQQTLMVDPQTAAKIKEIQ